jgi:hypothetical protein
MADSTTKHAGWIPNHPSMSQGSGLAPDWENLGGSADTSTTLAAGDTPKGATSSMAQSSGEITTRIMEDGIDYTMPSSNQGNLEPQGPGVKGAG